MKNDVVLLASIIKKRRITLGYSLRSLAKEVGISHTELARIENGNRTNFSLVVIARLCEILKLDFINLLTITGYIPSNSQINNYFENYDTDEEEYEDDYDYDDEEIDDIIDFDFTIEINLEENEMYITLKLANDWE